MSNPSSDHIVTVVPLAHAEPGDLVGVQTKHFWESKTFWVGVATVVLGLGEYLTSAAGRPLLPLEYVPAVVSALGLLAVGLRFATSQPVK
jgi:hypothetical protein